MEPRSWQGHHLLPAVTAAGRGTAALTAGRAHFASPCRFLDTKQQPLLIAAEKGQEASWLVAGGLPQGWPHAGPGRSESRLPTFLGRGVGADPSPSKQGWGGSARQPWRPRGADPKGVGVCSEAPAASKGTTTIPLAWVSAKCCLPRSHCRQRFLFRPRALLEEAVPPQGRGLWRCRKTVEAVEQVHTQQHFSGSPG